jgi:hypothetical protein
MADIRRRATTPRRIDLLLGHASLTSTRARPRGRSRAHFGVGAMVGEQVAALQFRGDVVVGTDSSRAHRMALCRFSA